MELHAPREGRRDEPRVPPLLAIGAADVEGQFTGTVVEVAQRAQQHTESLAPRFHAGEEQAQRAGLPGVAGAEPLQIDARRDDAIGAGEGERRRVSRGARRGHGSIERVEQAPQLRPRGPEGRHTLGVRVKRRHQGAAGVPQRRPPEAGDERLVKVQHVEVLGLEQHVDVGDQVRRGGDKLERATLAHRVGGAGEEEARVRLVGQEDRVPLAGEHGLHAAPRLADRQPVGAGGDHGDAVTARRESLDERLHLAVHARRRRPEKRREDADLVAHDAHATARGRASAAGGIVPGRNDGRAGAIRPRPASKIRATLCSPPQASVSGGHPWQTAPAPGPSPAMNSSVMRRH